ncbi:MAG: ROK family glucokinase [Oscillospiraceae bacterium]|nr:ROK family glucokinase [Oscillospiraceae bacterium]
MKYGFGVDLGGTTVKLAYFDTNGSLLDKWEIPTVTANAGAQILPDIAASIHSYIHTHRIQKEAVLGIGIGVPGPVDSKGTVNRCVNLGWDSLNVEHALSALTGFPVRAGNDANLAALGECWKGGGQGCENMVLVTLGTGIGGGIIINGSVFFGAHGSAGEIGHMILNRNEQELHTSGVRGCAEQYCSATGIVRLANRYLENNDTPSVLRNIHPLTCKAVFDAGNRGDPAAQAILEAFYELLGEFLANVCNVLDPELVLLGGGVSKAGSTLLEGVRPYFRQKVFHAIKDVDFSIAALGNDAGVYGAFKLALQSFCK